MTIQADRGHTACWLRSYYFSSMKLTLRSGAIIGGSRGQNDNADWARHQIAMSAFGQYETCKL